MNLNCIFFLLHEDMIDLFSVSLGVELCREQTANITAMKFPIRRQTSTALHSCKVKSPIDDIQMQDNTGARLPQVNIYRYLLILFFVLTLNICSNISIKLNDADEHIHYKCVIIHCLFKIKSYSIDTAFPL